MAAPATRDALLRAAVLAVLDRRAANAGDCAPCLREAGAEIAPLLDALRHSQTSGTCFAVARRQATFLGCSPERLVQLAGRHVEAEAVAGSAACRRGASSRESSASDAP